MSYDYSAIKNKQQKHPKVYFSQYLSTYGEPEDDISHDSPPELEAELLEINGRTTRRRFREIAQRLRNRH